MNKNDVLITFITAVFNNKKGLEKTLESTRPFIEKYRFIEHLIIDAKSSDGSTETALQYAKGLDNCNVIVEKDKGIYDALNKGTKFASGKLLMLMHSGDELEEKGFRNFIEEENIDTTKIHAFDFLLDETTGLKLIKRKRIFSLSTDIKHPALIIPKKHLLEINGYPLEFNVSADVYAIHKIIVTLFDSDYEIAIDYYDYPIITMEPFGFSAEKKNFSRKKIEHIKIFYRINGLSIKLLRLAIRNVLRILKVKLLR